jgi:hypothetical protein
MADKGYINTLVNGITDDTTRLALSHAFAEVLDNFRVGPVEDRKRAVNGQSYFFTATTPTVANTEFTVTHGQGQTPLWMRPIAPLDAVNAQVVPLTVSRVADAQRMYLKSSSTNVTVFLEVGF